MLLALVVEGSCALARGPLAARFDGSLIGAEARFAEAIKVQQRKRGQRAGGVSEAPLLPPPPAKKATSAAGKQASSVAPTARQKRQ